MSRIGKKPIQIPDGVKVSVKDNLVEVNGPKGKLSQEITAGITIQVDEKEKVVTVDRPGDSKLLRARQGLYRSLLANMVEGVVKPFEKKLEIVGTGYNAKLQGRDVVLNIGFCHPVVIKVEEGLEVETPKPVSIVIRGADKQRVGQLAADIRAIRPPEPYNGKGIKYEDEQIRRKAGKTFVGGA